MFQSVILLFISIIPSCLGLSEAVCPSGIGFLDLEDFKSNTPQNALYFYNGAESIGSSNRFIFPNLTVPCYVNIEKIALFQSLPFACIQARAKYEFELWTAVPDKPGSYELVYAEFLTYINTVSPQIFLYPNKDLIMYPGDVIGFRNSTLNFFNQYNAVQPRRTISTYWGLIHAGTSCQTYSQLEFGKDVFYQGDWTPYFNFSFTPQTPEFTEFQIRNNSYLNLNTSVQPLLLYHRGIYRPICNHLWHIRTADVLCQMANFSHAEDAYTVPTLDPSSLPLTHLSEYYWLDYIYCPDYVVESQKCLRSSWECVTNCSTFNQSAAASCAMEEGRTRFVLRELEYNSSNFDALFEFSPAFSIHKIPTIQIYYKQQWRNLSNISSQNTLEVICRSQGYTQVFFSSEAKTYSSFENGIQLDCTGLESHTSECRILEYSNSTSYLPILACLYEEGHVSLYNNHSHSRSRGEVQYSINSSSTLAFVCTDSWSSIESSVVCEQLGYQSLHEYSLILATLTDQSQYNYYMQIDTLHSIQADFLCSGYESSLRSCEVHTPLQPSNSTVCLKNIVSLSCATRQQILSREIDCYSYTEFLHPSLGYRFNTDNSSNCLSLYDVLPLSNNNNTKYTRVRNYFIQSITFGRTISMNSNFIKLDTTSGRYRRDVGTSLDLCYVVYFDSNGTAVSVAGITNSSTLTYTTLYNVTMFLGGVNLTGNLTNLEEPVNTTSMSLVCNRDGVNISGAYLLSSYSRDNPDTVITPDLIGNFDSLQELQLAYTTVLTPPTTPTYTTNTTNTPTNQTSPPQGNLVLIYSVSSTLVLFFIIVSVFVCLLQLLRRHYKREIVTLQIQSKAVVSNVYSHEDVSTQLACNHTNNYVQQNVYYYKLKLQSNTCAMFVESTKSLRSTIHRVTMVPKFGVTTPLVNYVDVNSKRQSTSTDHWHVERDSLVYLRELGLGYYGKVQLMEAKNVYGYDKLPVAVKTLSTQDKVQTEKFMAEVNLMMSIRNEYIVSLLGFCPPTQDATPLMVLEYMEFGDVKSLVRSYRDADSTRESELNILHLVSMAMDISSALVYLSEHLYIHRDIAARNCLVGKSLMCKLSDFGLALVADENGTTSLSGGGSTTVPIKWTAPETFTSKVFSFSSDVWSYGVFLWELFTYGSEPLEEFTKAGFISAIKNGTLVLPHIPNVPAFCNDLIQMCCFFNPLQRPGIKEVRSIIEGVLIQEENEDSHCDYSFQDDSSCLVESIM